MAKNIELTPKFKAQTAKAILSIILFSLIYILLLFLAICLTVLCICLAFLLVTTIPAFYSIILGIGFGSLGVLILVYLVKFIFKRNKVDRSHLYEITNKDEPEFFKLIEEIVIEVDTSFPKKVYLSSDVNAAVFYDSSFLSMFLPIKKNLQVGLGLVNAVTKAELKAILSHEFGHFSQKTMKVGSYVYTVNHIIFNMLYDNDSYDKLVTGWARLGQFFSIFVLLAEKIIRVIQWVLKKMYEIVNKSYLGLSREMEFQADEIAASVTGCEPLKTSLLRLSLADYSFNNVLSFYNEKIENNLKSDNLYKEHIYVMECTAKDNNIPSINNFPNVTKEELNRFNKSKLVIKNQWASHPSIKERIERLERNNFKIDQNANEPANNIFVDIEETQKKITNEIFKAVEYKGEAVSISFDEFKSEYKSILLKNSFPKIYNGYYNCKNPMAFDLNTKNDADNKKLIEYLFSDKKVELVYTALALQEDIEVLKQIDSKDVVDVKTFDYDGEKYKKKECKNLQAKLENELEIVNNKIKENDIEIYYFFKKLENEQKRSLKLQSLYSVFYEFDKEIDAKNELYFKFLNELYFINFTTPFEEIYNNFTEIKPLEVELKNEINQILNQKVYEIDLTKEIKDNFETYISKQLTYFSDEHYLENNLKILMSSLHSYYFLLSRRYFLHKMDLLNYQEELFKFNY